MSKPDPKSYFDMSDKKKKKIIDKASKGAIEAQRDLIAKADSVAKQKECKCIDYCYVTGGDYECREECLFCKWMKNEEQPDPSLKTWEEEVVRIAKMIIASKGDMRTYEIKHLTNFLIASQISLAVQKERERSKGGES